MQDLPLFLSNATILPPTSVSNLHKGEPRYELTVLTCKQIREPHLSLHVPCHADSEM